MPRSKYSLEDFDFSLPEDLIAQYPSPQRDESRLFVLHRDTNRNEHRLFREIPTLLRAGDVLVFNDSRVIPARIFCTRETGGRMELLLTDREDDFRWTALCSRKKRLRTGEIIHPEERPEVGFHITGKKGDAIQFVSSVPLSEDNLELLGNVPLPPYIRRPAEPGDRERYQTVFADAAGSVAAPTAGLHFTAELMSTIQGMGIETVFLTLGVSWGTFLPVREGNLEEGRLHSERYALTEDAAQRINSARDSGGRVIAVGTTSLRVLETTFAGGHNRAGSGTTDIFIHPPYSVQSADAMITNFHTPRSSLLMLVSAFAGYERLMKAYEEAVELRYRFFSYGDAMFITP
ncbi:MAG: tRNA preQ1(34) S-adenosylmethionine ribosyltransferase-isomerase QueA [Spirochaetes bacterium]|nr:tRNA preQ1(34) S-adenosylmethionine ribosyltransferase-isomerase QueA [Spirochaetota bacterium]